VDVAITPQPPPEDREALVAGLERLVLQVGPALPEQYRSAWRRIGLVEAPGAEAADAFGPRRAPGMRPA
jgi:hypothetical protein